jgi:hypothetical protein
MVLIPAMFRWGRTSAAAAAADNDNDDDDDDDDDSSLADFIVDSDPEDDDIGSSKFHPGSIASAMIDDPESGKTEKSYFVVLGRVHPDTRRRRRELFEIRWLYTKNQVVGLGGVFESVQSKRGKLFDSDHTQELAYDSSWSKLPGRPETVGRISRADNTVDYYVDPLDVRARHAIEVLTTRGSSGTPSKKWKELLSHEWETTSMVPHHDTCTGCDSVHTVTKVIRVERYPEGCSYSSYFIGSHCMRWICLAKQIHDALGSGNNSNLSRYLDEFRSIHCTREGDDDDDGDSGMC